MKLSYGWPFVLIASVLLISCSASNKARHIKRSIKGDWLLETITTQGIQGKVTARLFNEAPFNCFVGSAWNFVANNTTGSYRFNNNGSECNSTQRQFRWTILDAATDTAQVQFKRMGDNNEELDNGDGFRLKIVGVTDTSMQLQSNIRFEGKPAAYIYNFVKK